MKLHHTAIPLAALLIGAATRAAEPVPAVKPATEPAPAAAAPAAPADPAAPAGDPSKLIQGKDSHRYATQEDLESARDILEEKIVRGVGSRYLVSFSGFATVGYYNARTTNTADQGSNFRLANANLSFSGFLRENPIDDGDLRYKLSVFYAGPANSSTAGNVSSIQATDAVLLWDLVRQKKRLEPLATLNVTVGQQLVPFGSDNTATEDKIPTINLAQYLGAFKLRRDIGVTVDGGLLHRYDAPSGVTVPLIAYTVGVYNGSGANKWDDNKAKDVVAKVLVTPEEHFFSIFRGLTFGGSFYKGNVGQTALRKDRAGAELSYLHKPFLLTGEYVQGWDESQVGTDTKTTRSRSYVATLFYTDTTLPDFQPLVRFDYLDPDRIAPDVARSVLTVGFNWFFWQVEPVTRRTYEVAKTERVVKLQVNYNRVWDKAVHNENQFLAQVVASF